MHGAPLAVCVTPGEQVEKGARLAVLEAMKMHHVIVAPLGGTVIEVPASAGTQIGAGDVILVIAAEAG